MLSAYFEGIASHWIASFTDVGIVLEVQVRCIHSLSLIDAAMLVVDLFQLTGDTGPTDSPIR